jgi:putative membrane protein
LYVRLSSLTRHKGGSVGMGEQVEEEANAKPQAAREQEKQTQPMAGSFCRAGSPLGELAFAAASSGCPSSTSSLTQNSQARTPDVQGVFPVIDYDRTSWWLTCFSWRGTVLPHILARVGLLTAFCLGLYLLNEFVLPQANQLMKLDPVGHTILGVALSMLIVFRTNSAHSRFWEARSHWGVIVNTSRNLVRMAAVFTPPADDLARLVSAYVLLLKEQLRDNRDLAGIRHLVTGRVLDRLAKSNNPAQMLAAELSDWIASRMKEGRIEPILAARLESLVGLLVDQQGGCEKIRRTPLPFVYAALIKEVLFIYLATLPFVLVPVMGFMAPLVLMGVSLGMLGIEEAGVEIEDPFGLDPNHLPLDQICATIGRDVSDLTAGEETHV